MRKFAYITIVGLVAFLCALWSPWNNWNLSILTLFGLEKPESVAGLQVTSLVGEMEVFIDGISVGKVDPESSPLAVPGIEPGQRRVKLVRKTNVEGGFWIFNKLIEFTPDVDVVISYELGPSEDFSEGHIISTGGKLSGIDGVSLNIEADVRDAEIFLDNTRIGTIPLLGYNLTLSRQHKLRLVAEGYDTQEFTLLPAEQAQRDKLAGLQLNVFADMFLQPIQVQ